MPSTGRRLRTLLPPLLAVALLAAAGAAPGPACPMAAQGTGCPPRAVAAHGCCAGATVAAPRADCCQGTRAALASAAQRIGPPPPPAAEALAAAVAAGSAALDRPRPGVPAPPWPAARAVALYTLFASLRI